MTALADRLAAHRTLGAAPRGELEWLAERGQLRHLDAGEVLTAKASGRVEGLFVILSGRITIHVDRGAGRHKVAEWRSGDVTGLLPYSRLVSPPADSVAEEPAEILVVDRAHLPAMIVECHELTSILVHVMLDRARQFTSSALHDEKLVSLGKLAAGLAHELNNPASAAERSARLLSETLEESEQASRALGGVHLTDQENAALEAFRRACLSPARGVRPAIEQAAREDTLANWLESHAADPSIAEALAETALTLETLDRLAQVVRPEGLEVGLRWVAAGCSVRTLATEIQEATARISALVSAVKGFTRMDQATVAEPVDLHHGLDSTVAVLRSKARAKSVSVALELPSELPRVVAHAGELNQIWANLIDNALDAVPASGRVEVTARLEGRRVVVVVSDDGPGIPAEVLDRIFDPFFTTKPVGQGTGLGLDIVRRLVRLQAGEIEVSSRPGRTEFRVWLPAEGAAPA